MALAGAPHCVAPTLPPIIGGGRGLAGRGPIYIYMARSRDVWPADGSLSHSPGGRTSPRVWERSSLPSPAQVPHGPATDAPWGRTSPGVWKRKPLLSPAQIPRGAVPVGPSACRAHAPGSATATPAPPRSPALRPPVLLLARLRGLRSPNLPGRTCSTRVLMTTLRFTVAIPLH